jgi:hypothetical protein
MTPDEFREIVLSLPGAEESAHMGHPDFRVRGNIFATLGYPDESCGMVALTPTQQQEFMRIDPAFSPVNGEWGEKGATLITLAAADETTVREALNLAWKKRANRSP